MLTSQPEQPTRRSGFKYFYILGLLSGIGLTLMGLALLADFKSDYFDAHLFMGITGLLLVIIGLLPLMIFYRVWQRLPIERRGGQDWLTFLRTPWASLSLAPTCVGMALFSQNILPLLLGASSFIPDIISGLFGVGGVVLILMQFKRLASLYERMKQPQAANDQNLPAED
jgi:uncharacterized membrane protein YuzA (DUF378 family)